MRRGGRRPPDARTATRRPGAGAIDAIEHLRGRPGYPPGFYGTIRQRLPSSPPVGALSVLVGLIPFPHQRTGEIVVAGVALLPPHRRPRWSCPGAGCPQWFWPVIPIGFIAVIALIRDAQGGRRRGWSTLYVLPIVWLAFYGRRAQLVVGLVAAVVAMVVPDPVLSGPPEYPASQWRLVVVTTVVATLVSFSFLTMVARDRAYVADLAEQSLLAAAERPPGPRRPRAARLAAAGGHRDGRRRDRRATGWSPSSRPGPSGCSATAPTRSSAGPSTSSTPTSWRRHAAAQIGVEPGMAVLGGGSGDASARSPSGPTSARTARGGAAPSP